MAKSKVVGGCNTTVGVPNLMWWKKSEPVVEIKKTDRPKSVSQSTLDEIKRQLSENFKNLESPAPTSETKNSQSPIAAKLVGGAQLVGGLERIAEEEEELRRRKEEKDQAFKAAVEAIDRQFNSFKPDVYSGWNTEYTDRHSSQFSGPSASPQSPDRQSTLDEIKGQLNENFKNFGVKEEKRRKEERLREIERETASNEYKERIERAYHELELQSTAHELDEWCEECGCIHESDIVNDY